MTDAEHKAIAQLLKLDSACRVLFEQTVNIYKMGPFDVWTAAWQAAERQALERALGAIRNLYERDGEWIYPHEKAIRALMNQDASSEKEGL